MINLIRKDFYFNIFHVFLSIIISIGFPFVYLLEGKISFIYIIYFFAPFVSSAIFINKACYLDDETLTRSFIFTLPLKRVTIVASKYVESVVMIVLSISAIMITSLILQYDISYQMFLTSFGFLLIYYSIYMYLYFKYNYNAAQKTTLIVIFGLVILIAVLERTKLNFESMNGWILSGVIVTIGVLLYYISITITSKNSKIVRRLLAPPRRG